MDPAHSRSARAGRGIPRWAVELGVAAFVAVVGAVVLYGSLEQGTGWSDTGPESGYFPFHIGLMIIAAAAINAYFALRARIRAARGIAPGETFIDHAKLRLVMQVFVPTTLYVVSIRWLGLYISSTLFVAAFMLQHGKYRWRALPTGVGISVFFYLVLELWFKVELFKGPLLEWLLER